jgi:hypothetical protein
MFAAPPMARAGRMLRTTAAVCAVTASAVAVVLAGAAPAAAAPPSCKTAGLVIWLDTNGNGTAGTIFYTLNFTNLSGHTCTLRGFPGVSAVNLSGHMMGKAASRDSGQTVKTVTLGNGKSAKATLGLVDVGALPQGACNPATAAGLRVFPPNQTSSKVIPFPFQGCSHAGPSFLRIRAVTKS